ncbi:unannotated protein [freshwater metagenome]|uniref:Unannotated protein n=1 Tax=freshwater metagenome TaxID=449393 RepID=A0A6J5YY00_9ZZZZ|nr:hypothetical protein [Actinomycetota bacterium]MSW26557.1 hypothetical protein [Actinomycetota bacterium]MSW34252.1 hypothetical protein [Actinomycetota bacterium]MSX31737.1 hypothetical protein [Actinomycetota bacterium]MSX51943.1 hypothetical protein [Actinomycetota bacterium]
MAPVERAKKELFPAESLHVSLIHHSPAVSVALPKAIDDVAMDQWQLVHYLHSRQRTTSSHADLELDQKSRSSRIRRATEKYDEELLRQSIILDQSRSIA